MKIFVKVLPSTAYRLMIHVENTPLLFAERFGSNHDLLSYQLCYKDSQRETQQLFNMRVVQEVHEMGFLYSDLGACKEKSWPMSFLS